MPRETSDRPVGHRDRRGSTLRGGAAPLLRSSSAGARLSVARRILCASENLNARDDVPTHAWVRECGRAWLLAANSAHSNTIKKDDDWQVLAFRRASPGEKRLLS